MFDHERLEMGSKFDVILPGDVFHDVKVRHNR